jgi:ring-1,2-phenylacetyl-CoA epoxidase subunit PaaC
MQTTEPSAAPDRSKQASAPSGASAPHAVGGVGAPIDYLLQLADNALILGQRNAEWCGHGPILEEDLALANNSLDLIGQARLLYQHAAQLIGNGATEDSLAYFRDVPDFRNYTLLELPHSPPLAATASGDRDYATTIVRNFLYSALMALMWERLQDSADPQLAAIAAKSLKEVRYHLRHSRDWLVRFGDGTDASHARAQAALDHLMPYTQEFWTDSAHETAAGDAGTGVNVSSLRGDWNTLVDSALAEATLKRPSEQGCISQGKHGVHSEHLGFVLAEMQSLARAHPQATW